MSISAVGSGSSALQNLLSRLDTDGNGKISKREFVSGRSSGVSSDQASGLPC